jgi:hypothetical protein
VEHFSTIIIHHLLIEVYEAWCNEHAACQTVLQGVQKLTHCNSGFICYTGIADSEEAEIAIHERLQIQDPKF